MNEHEFFERLKQNPRPVVVDFWALWCGPCRAIEPILKRLGTEYDGRVDVWRLNADESPDLLRSLHVYGIPTLVAFQSGQEIARHTGATSQAALSTLFDAALSGEKPTQVGPAPLDRILRLVAGAALLLLAFQGQLAGWHFVLAGLGAVVAFSAVYDRCPIYRAVSAQVSAWLHSK